MSLPKFIITRAGVLRLGMVRQHKVIIAHKGYHFYDVTPKSWTPTKGSHHTAGIFRALYTKNNVWDKECRFNILITAKY